MPSFDKAAYIRKKLADAKYRAKKQGVPFDLTPEDVIIPDHCPVLGLTLVPGDPQKAPSLDRIIPSLGYVKGNIVVVSNRANLLKGDATPKELELLASFYEWLFKEKERQLQQC